MADASAELASLQKELQAVKQALQKGDAYLGMRDEKLQQYFLQLNDKENLVLSRQVTSLGASAEPGSPSTAAAVPPPPGPVKPFDKDVLTSVLDHMLHYEAVPQECTKAVRALSSLAYADARGVGTDDQVIRQLLRTLKLHPAEEALQLVTMRALCNMAYDPIVCAEKFSTHEVLSTLLAAAAKMPEPNSEAKPSEASTKAGEALARIVASEVEGDLKGPVSPLGCVFTSACYGDASWHEAIVRLLKQLLDNEVIAVPFIAERFVTRTTVPVVKAALGWLSLAKVCSSSEELGSALLEAGAVRAAVQLMQRFSDEGAVALSGVEGLSALVGSRMVGLMAFVDAGGVQRIEAGMERHPGHELLQTKSIRALASGVLWAEDVQMKAGYSLNNSIDLTKAAMARHAASEELQAAGLEALVRYIEKADSESQVAKDDCEGLVKRAMTRHLACTKVQRFGRALLDRLGVDKSWKPGVAATNGATTP